MEDLRSKIQKAVKAGDTSYLNGVLQVEKVLFKRGQSTEERVVWLQNKIKELKNQ